MDTRILSKSLHIFFLSTVLLLAGFLPTNGHAVGRENQKPVQLAWWVHHHDGYYYRHHGYYGGYKYWTSWRQVSPRCQKKCLVDGRGIILRCVSRCY